MVETETWQKWLFVVDADNEDSIFPSDDSKLVKPLLSDKLQK